MQFRFTAWLTLSTAVMVGCHSDLNQPATGSIQLTIQGLGAGVEPTLTVVGPGDFQAEVTGTSELVGLAPGTYVVSAPDLDVDANVFSPSSGEYRVEVVNNLTTPLTIEYALSSGVIDLSVTGVPNGLDAAVVVTGLGVARTVTSTDLLTRLKAGTYAVLAAPIDSAGHVFSPGTELLSIELPASTTPTPVAVAYGLSTGRALVNIDGVPPGATAAVTIMGPHDFNAALEETGLLTRLAAGSYSVTATNIAAGGHQFAAAGATFDIVPSRTPLQLDIAYIQTTGELRVTVTGLPNGVNAPVDVTGDDFSRALPRSDTLVGLTPGTYSVTADSVNSGGFVYAPDDVSQIVNVQAGETVEVPVTYRFTGTTSLDLTVTNAYLVQSVQRIDGDVALVAGRDAYARIFVTANETNTVAANARLRVYHNGTIVQTFDITPDRTNTPTSILQQFFDNSWNVFIPGSLIVEGLAIDVVADPTNVVPESNDQNNTYPSSAAPLAVDVRSLPPFQVTFVPVRQGASTGNVTTSNALQFLDDTRRMFPMHAVEWDIHAPMTTTASTLMSGNQNNAWNTVLSEVRALRIAEGATSYYYGVVKVNYSSGVAGMGYVPSSATSSSKASIGWDYLPSGADIMAHELGHNFGRNHAPCGDPAGVDLSYPYPNAAIGHFGLDVDARVVKPSSLPDVMSYCSNPWVSDYTYEGILARRQAEAAASTPTAAATTGILVWGRIVNGTVILEPAFEMEQTPHLPSNVGPYLLEGIAEDGRTVFSYRFDGEVVADLPGPPEQHFAFIIPHDPQTTPLSVLRVTAAGVTAERSTPVRAAPGAAIATVPLSLARVDADRVRLQWDVAAAPMVLVQDAVSGQILAFARGGDATVWTTARDVRLIVSDGVRSVVR